MLSLLWLWFWFSQCHNQALLWPIASESQQWIFWSSEVCTSWHGSRARLLHEEYVTKGFILLPITMFCFDNQFLKKKRSGSFLPITRAEKLGDLRGHLSRIFLFRKYFAGGFTCLTFTVTAFSTIREFHAVYLNRLLLKYVMENEISLWNTAGKISSVNYNMIWFYLKRYSERGSASKLETAD